DARARQQAAERELHGFVLEHLDAPGERQRCEQQTRALGPPPSRRPPPPPPSGARGRQHRAPARIFAYDAAGVPRASQAPPLDVDALEGLAPGGVVSRSTLWNAGEVELLLRTPWGEGPCSYVLAQGTKEPWLGAILPDTQVWLLPVVVVFLAVVASVGPFVRRLRRLAASVERQASAGYLGEVEPVTGNDEVAELGRAFAAAGREVQAQLAHKDQREQALRDFLADTTHDVMIPLTVLQGDLATLRDQLDAREPCDPAALRSAMHEAHYIASLLHDLATAAKLDTGQPDLQRVPVDLGGLVRRVVARHRPIGRQLGVSLECAAPEPPRQVHADPTMLEQALGNLVYNAVRHNRPEGHVAVFVDDAGPERFAIHVVDDGPGIGAATLAALRERGVRGDEARTRAPGGRGLGLDIAVRVCELHGFSLRLEPGEYGGGLHARIEGSILTPAPPPEQA
ncbi:MAG: HAMP domain-containing histidine kinase, partial [Myxococcales bacterium]|nr:HAMP domain-containing histidine kinase [Myxococcales bacterium]